MVEKRALHLLNSIKQGGGENVALNYGKILNELSVKSFFFGRRSSSKYWDLMHEVGEVKERWSIKDLHQSDYIFVHTNKNLLKLFILFPFVRRSQKRIFYIQHLFFGERKFKILSFFINHICTDFVQISPITADMVNRCIQIRKHFIVNFFINKYSKLDYHHIRRQVREELGIDDSIKIILFSGIFKPGKNLSDFLYLARQFNQSNNYVFLLIGDGAEVDIVRQYGFDNLKWLGMVNDVEKYLIASDIYFFPSRFKGEMLPMALVEAINTGIRIMAYSTTINNFLLDGSTYQSISEVLEAIPKEITTRDFPMFDKSYAIKAIKQMLYA